jgi:hypothetical protein
MSTKNPILTGTDWSLRCPPALLETRRRVLADQDVILIAAVLSFAAAQTQFDFAIFRG